MNPEAAKRFRLLASIVSVVLVAALLAAGWFYTRMRASLPQLDGGAKVSGLAAAATLARDSLGVPTIHGENRLDVSRALGWLHGQDRFFQMDLLRRSPAGELAELFGQRAVPRDRAFRMHGFRKIAEKVVAALPPQHRAIVEAYTAGVNAGLTALGERPFEYLVLRTRPQPWRVEDSVLVIYAMTIDLQDETGSYEQALMTLRDQLGTEALAFFAPAQTPADAALDGSTGPVAAIPGPKVLDLRAAKAADAKPTPPRPALTSTFPFPTRDPEAVLGSNAFALAGSHTANGAGMLANDMHLNLAVPNIWYRASLEFPGHKITGVTLPGVPVVVAGSNGRVAWGLTDAYADTGDLVVVEASGYYDMYPTPGQRELLEIEMRPETIHVTGGDDVTVKYPWTIWGPIVGTNERGKSLAYHWTAHDPAATNLELIAMEDAHDVAEALRVAQHSGMPASNLVVADHDGAIAWTIAGRLPKRVGYDGQLPVSWAFGDRRWDGYWPANEVPVVASAVAATNARPPSNALVPALAGRIWSANQRMLGGEGLRRIGDAGYARPYRAAQIRDGLAPLEKATPRDLLAIQLDDRALFLAPWRQRLLDTLTPPVIAAKKSRATLRELAEKWDGHASIDSVSYRLAREYRTAVYARIFPAIFASCIAALPDFHWERLPLESAVWTLIREKPAHLLNPEFTSWDQLLVAAADDVVTSLDQQGVALRSAKWGQRNKARIQHPFGAVFPRVFSWLNLPADPLPGDADLPRVQGPSHGASERFVVSPGHEAEGYFHMPGGQSGHPFSPFYRAGHTAWARGEPTPFLPGKTEHTLTLSPP